MHGARLTHSQVAPTRLALLAAQRGVCAICKTPITAKDTPVLDHDHSTGAVRGVLHHSCNAVLGKIENSYQRFGLSKNLFPFLAGVGGYLLRHRTNVTGYIHPTHKTEDEKRLAKNAKARKVRAARKVAK